MFKQKKLLFRCLAACLFVVGFFVWLSFFFPNECHDAGLPLQEGRCGVDVVTGCLSLSLCFPEGSVLLDSTPSALCIFVGSICL